LQAALNEVSPRILDFQEPFSQFPPEIDLGSMVAEVSLSFPLHKLNRFQMQMVEGGPGTMSFWKPPDCMLLKLDGNRIMKHVLVAENLIIGSRLYCDSCCS
jgi:hypothetical protein